MTDMKKPRCFVIMPFGRGDEYEGGAEESLYLFNEIIVPAVVGVLGGGDPRRVTIERELGRYLPGSIPADIIKNLAEADFVIADITGRNPNVYLELGIRYSLRRRGTILMLKDGSGSLPFNVSHFRVVNYSYFPWKKLDGRENLEKTLKELIEPRPGIDSAIDSPVFEAFEAYDIAFPNPFRQQDQDRAFGALVDAKPRLLELSRACIAEDAKLEIKYIGMTMFNAWNTLLSVLDNLRTTDTNNVSLRVAMLDPDWLRHNVVRKSWTPDQANGLAQQIASYLTQHPHLKDRGWSVAVRHYAHMPCLHGTLLNDKYLFWGLCRWQKQEMYAGDRSYDLSFSSEDRGRDRVDVFRGWFDHCYAMSREKKARLAQPLIKAKRGARNA